MDSFIVINQAIDRRPTTHLLARMNIALDYALGGALVVTRLTSTLLFWAIWAIGMTVTLTGVACVVAYYRNTSFRTAVDVAKTMFKMIVVPAFRSMTTAAAKKETTKPPEPLFDTCIRVASSRIGDFTVKKTWKNITSDINAVYADESTAWPENVYALDEELYAPTARGDVDINYIGNRQSSIYYYTALPPRAQMLQDAFKLTDKQADLVRLQFYPLFRKAEDEDEEDDDESSDDK